MKKSNTVLMAGAGCIVLGALFLICGFLLGGRPGFTIDRQGIHSTANTLQNQNDSAHIQEKIKLDAFQNADIRLEYADLHIIPSDGYYLEYRLTGSRQTPSWKNENGTFSFGEGSAPDNNFHFTFFSMDSFLESEETSYYVNLYIPQDAVLEDLNIYNSYGDAELGTLSCQNVSVTLEYGDLSLADITAETEATFTCDLGNLELNSLHTNTCTLRNEYGNISCNSISGDNCSIFLESGTFRADTLKTDRLTLENSYGDVRIRDGNITQGEIALDSGDLDVSLSDTDVLSVRNEYGDVSLQLDRELSSYHCELVTEYGEILLPDYTVSDSSGSARYTANENSNRQISVSCESGDIQIR